MTMLIGLPVVVFIALIFSMPVAWLIMLFLGNVGVNVSLWGAVPAALLAVMTRITMNTPDKKKKKT